MSSATDLDDGGRAALRRAIGAGNVDCPTDPAALDDDEVAAVRAILAGQVAPGFAVDIKRALGALARSDGSAETAELLARFLSDRRAPLRERAAAAAYLGRLPPTVAEPALLSALDRTVDELRAEVVKSLGQVGSGQALDRLRAIDTGDEVVGRQVSLSRLLIGLREGCDDSEAPDIARALDIGWVTTEAASLEADAVRDTLAAVEGPVYNLAFNQEIGFSFACRRVPHAVLLSAGLRRGELVRTLSNRAMIAGVIVTRAERMRAYGVRWLLLTSPTTDGVRMVLVRKSGEPALEGLGVRDGAQLRFRLRDTGLDRTPAEIEGDIGDEDVRWTMRTWTGGLRRKQRPHPIAR